MSKIKQLPILVQSKLTDTVVQNEVWAVQQVSESTRVRGNEGPGKDRLNLFVPRKNVNIQLIHKMSKGSRQFWFMKKEKRREEKSRKAMCWKGARGSLV